LPFYSHWLARRPYLDESPQHREDVRLAAAEELWANTHHLTQMLSKPDPEIIHKSPRQDASLSQQTDRVRQQFADLEQPFQQLCLSLLDVNLQSVLRELEGVLQVPFIEPTLRLQLVNNAHRVSHRLLIETTATTRELPALDTAGIRDLYKRDAGRQ